MGSVGWWIFNNIRLPGWIAARLFGALIGAKAHKIEKDEEPNDQR